ncbi:MAG: large repetitive protein [Methylobacteriaceae bacterium]|nr:large repetitive protein [Methylobacteriaceae bacterium]
MSSLVIGGTTASFVQEDFAVTGGNISSVGGLTISGGQGQASFAPQSSTAGTYGTFTFAANGVWSYTADNSQAAIQVLGNGDFLTDSFTAVSSDGTASQPVTVTILGTNDLPTIGGVSGGEVTEDVAVTSGNLTISGTLTIADPDQGQSSFTARSSVVGTFGTFAIAANGTWTYTANDSQWLIQQLDVGQWLTDSFRAVSSDGSVSQTVTVTINGTNDVPVIGGYTTASVTEDRTLADGSLSVTGILSITDADADAQLRFTPRSGVAGTYGTFTLTPTGVWTYTADNSQTAIQQLGDGQSLTDSFTAVSLDGLASQLVTVAINGTNDDPVIGGASTGVVTEDTNLLGPSLITSGTLTIADADQGQSSFAPQSNVTGTYGTFSLTADGVWTYTSDDNQTAIQELGSGQLLTDSFWAVSSDGSGEAYVMVTITGTNDVPVIGGVSTGSVTEDTNLTGTNLTASGTLTIADADQGQSSFAQPFRTGTYGIFTLAANGAWTYTLDDRSPAVQQLGAGQSITDSFTATSSDGSASQAVTVTINGVNDLPTIVGDSTGSVSENANGSPLTAGGMIAVFDADAGQSSFAPQSSTAGRYGIFTLIAGGTWTYTANSSQPALQQLGLHQSLVDSFTAVSSDGTATQVVSVTISGVNQPPFAAPALVAANFGFSAAGWASNDSNPRRLADVNGDGMADIVAFGSTGVSVSLATGNGGFTAPINELSVFAQGDGWNSNINYPRDVADVNGDGMADIIGFGGTGVWVSLATGNGGFAAPVFEVPVFAQSDGWASNDRYPRELADVNGDGMADIVAFGSTGVWVSLATGAGRFAAPVFELPVFAEADGWTSNDRYPRELADVNGDGMADIVGFGATGVWVSLASGGGGFVRPVFESTAFAPSTGWNSNDQYPRELADLNGDHMADIVGFGATGVWVSLATGNGQFGAPAFDLPLLAQSDGWSNQTSFPRELADVTGDHHADIVGFGSTGVWVSQHG